MKKTGLLLIVIMLQLGVTLGLGATAAFGHAQDRAPDGFIIWGQDLSGLGRADSFSKIKNKIPTSVSYDGQIFPLKLDQSYADVQKWLDQFFPRTTGVWFADALHYLSHAAEWSSTQAISLNREEIISQLEKIETRIDKPSRPATIAYQDGRLVRTEGQEGRTLDIDKTWEKISETHGNKTVPMVVHVVSPQPALSDLMNVKDILGDYTTFFNVQDAARTTNVRLAALALNNRIIAPGEVFSFNGTVGERTEASGYLPAFIFVDQAVIKGDGGGVCQDSSTLFQAVRQAHLPVKERHTHSLPVSYVLKGQDATVSYGSLDFQFKNDTRGYLVLSARTGSNWLRIRIFGQADAQHPVLPHPDGYPTHPEDWGKDPK